ncbi:Transcriptional regulator, AsnC family protein [Roseovarius sp. EC-HK134]|jgi:DNA-binding Lrp family transcriptional regulator|uniref:Regulatory protein AsnC n=1 Tax=Roseovarius mucosus TaxID=215743 RepID=A0A1V0RLC8_9RHOB|nr:MULTISPECIES: Lrp/AsnC family transcriptional regulator [Roseovarius]ARE82589.1 regulatory protein AsnC [Roseovarius mucosus]AWZ18750.1 Transcriptional regulator, AsnC family [Roseovarius sp. AK1035]EDM32399.1 Transcriptional regulator, AsnC family protein [Roseovarius sp. TM1035]VVT22096.1 Transcriptional regulator, AsnC family protein [Roseovarius sp. EC-SD190]VVT22728.1 Transcriptional regulator, AsnC family protein [Roseovarius sp. EC-HK134]
MQTDETDRALIALLQENARLPVATLARRLGLARTTVQARLERLENAGIITGYSVRLSQSARPALRATALVSIEPRSGPAVLARLKSLPQVRRVHTTSGRFDLIVTLEAETTEALDETLDRIGEAKGVRGSESLIHLSTKLDRGA